MFTGRLRVGFVIPLAMAGLSAVAFPLIGHAQELADRHAAARMALIAAAIPDPADAVTAPAGTCHGDGIHRCLRTPRTPDAVLADYVAALAAVTDEPLSTQCDSFPARVPSEPGLRSCVARVLDGDHAVLVSVDSTTALRDGRQVPDGTLVVVQTD
jgi:hypothetical protein